MKVLIADDDPISRAAAVRPREAALRSGETGMARKIRVVDDENTTLHPLVTLLRRHGYDVTSALDGTQAVMQAHKERPDLILLDVMMPVMDGYEVCRALRREPATAKIPVVMVTASEGSGLRRNAYAGGAQACVPKPVRREALVATVNILVAGLHLPPG